MNNSSRRDGQGEAVKIAFIVGSWESYFEQPGMPTTSCPGLSSTCDLIGNPGRCLSLPGFVSDPPRQRLKRHGGMLWTYGQETSLKIEAFSSIFHNQSSTDIA
jgi:hypothetical protein